MTREQLLKRLARIRSFASWNVRTLVESAAGDKRICRSRSRYRTQSQTPPNCHEVDRKLDFVVKELRRLRISIAGIQEMKWFGRDIWNADGYTLIHSGRPLLNEDVPQRRNEGVGILLDERATQAWKDAGENWKAVSSRVVMARLKVVHRGQRRPGGSRETSNTYLSIVSTYAPTAKAPPGIKTKFVYELQDTLDSVPHNDILILLGDFNARVGKCEFEEDIWGQVRQERNFWSSVQ